MVRIGQTQSLFGFHISIALCLVTIVTYSGVSGLHVGLDGFRPEVSQQLAERSEDSRLLPRQGPCSASSPCGMGLCCSSVGYCNTDAAHCGSGCVSQCHSATAPSCSGSSATGRTVGYWQSVNLQRSCQTMSVSQINTKGLTHLNFAFAIFDPNTLAITGSQPGDSNLYPAFTALKSSTLQTWIAVGGGGNPNCPASYWSTMAASSSKRATFIANLKSFMATNHFQGADLDWEFPANAADMANYVSLVSEMKSSFGSTYGISFTMPPDLGDIQNYQAMQMLPYVNFINFMAYDMAQWTPGSETTLEAQTDINYIIPDSLPFWWDGFTASTAAKLNLGMALYGRGYTLQSNSCITLGCAATGYNAAGPCTNTPGILSLREIEWLINTQGIISTLAASSMIKYIAWGNQWVGYDDQQTIAMKTQWASKNCFGGTALWSVDFAPGPVGNDPKPPTVSTNSQCGYKAGGGSVTCQGSQWGNCCSQHGYCGSGPLYCDLGCQSGCYSDVSQDGSCGSLDNNIICGNWTNASGATGLCCSQHGYCGATSDYCGSGCQSGPCT